MDLENLGNGSLVTFMIISGVLLLCYVLDGRFVIQSFFLEWVSNGQQKLARVQMRSVSE
jgi:hypothetical protein